MSSQPTPINDDDQPPQPSPKISRPPTGLKKTTPASPWHVEGTTQSYRCYKCRSFLFTESSLHRHMRMAHQTTLDGTQRRRCLWKKGRPEPRRNPTPKKMKIPPIEREKIIAIGDDNVTVVQIPHTSKRHLDDGDNNHTHHQY